MSETINIKYNCMIDKQAVEVNINRLTNQLWKLIPMRENQEDWTAHLKRLIIEISGLFELFSLKSSGLALLSKLEGLLITETEFIVYRKIVFESISLLREIIK